MKNMLYTLRHYWLSSMVLVLIFGVSAPLFSVKATSFDPSAQLEDGGKGGDEEGDEFEDGDESEDGEEKGFGDDNGDEEEDGKDDGEDGDEGGDEKSGGPEDEDGDGIPDDMEGWESPYESPADLIAAVEAAESNGTCWEYTNAKYNLLLDETRYWSSVAAPESEGKSFISKVLDYILELQLGIGKNRIELEKASGSVTQCELNDDFAYIAEPLEMIKLKMRRAGWLIDTGDSQEVTEELVEQRCEKAEGEVEDLSEKISQLSEDLNERVAKGDLEGVSNAKELLTMAQLNYGNASSALTESEATEDLEERLRACSGAKDEAAMGVDLFGYADKFHEGKKEDKSDPVEEIDAKIKMFLSFIAQKRVELLSRESDDRDAVLEALSVAEEKIVETQIAFAQVKYSDNPATEEFDDLLEAIKSDLKDVVDALDDTEAKEIGDDEREESAVKLFKKARKQIRELNQRLNRKEDKADTEEEENILLFVEQTTVSDAATARDAARAFRNSSNFQEAQLQAYTAIHTAKMGKETLGEIQ